MEQNSRLTFHSPVEALTLTLSRGERESVAMHRVGHVVVAITEGWHVPVIPRINGSEGQEVARGAG